jgi:hypothetical protein
VIFEKKNNEIIGAQEPKIFTPLTPHYIQWDHKCWKLINVIFEKALKSPVPRSQKSSLH